MSKKYADLSRIEKIKVILERPGVAVDLIDNQNNLISAMKKQIDIQIEMLQLYKDRLNAMDGGRE